MTSKLNNRNYIKFHLEESERFSKFLRSKLNELNGNSNLFIFASKYSYLLKYLKFLWKCRAFRYLVIGFGILLLLFGITELLSIDYSQLNELNEVNEVNEVNPVNPQERRNILSRFTLFLGNVERQIRKTFIYLLSVCIVVGSVVVFWYVYRRVKGIPLDAPFLPHHSEVGTQTELESKTEAIQTIDQNTMSDQPPLLEGPSNNSLSLEGGRAQSLEGGRDQSLEGPTSNQSLLLEALEEPSNQVEQSIEPVQSKRPIRLCIIEHIKNCSADEESRVKDIMKMLTSKRRDISHSLMRQIGTLNDPNSPELEVFLNKTLDELDQLDKQTLTDLENRFDNEIELKDTDAGDFDF